MIKELIIFFLSYKEDNEGYLSFSEDRQSPTPRRHCQRPRHNRLAAIISTSSPEYASSQRDTLTRIKAYPDKSLRDKALKILEWLDFLFDRLSTRKSEMELYSMPRIVCLMNLVNLEGDPRHMETTYRGTPRQHR